MADHTQTLQQAFDFSAEELELNRSGQLSAKQKARVQTILNTRKTGQRLALIGLGLPLGGMSGYLIFLASQPQNAIARPYLLGFAGVLLLTLLILLIRGILSRRKLANGTIKSIEGNVKTWSKNIGENGNRYGTAYYLKVGRRTFQLEVPAQIESLNQGRHYRFFYVPNGAVPIILSVEAI